MASKHEQTIINHLRSNPGCDFTMKQLRNILNIPYNHYNFLRGQVDKGIIEVVNPDYTPKSYRYVSPVITMDSSSENNTTTTTITITITTTTE